MSDKTLEQRIADCDPVTRAEAVQHFSAVNKFTCRGHRLHTPDEEKALKGRFDACKTVEERLALKKELEDKFKVPESARKPATTWEEAGRTTLSLIYSYMDSVGRRKNTCGQSLNEVFIADGKFDGEKHTVACPKCKEPHTYSVFYNVQG